MVTIPIEWTVPGEIKEVLLGGHNLSLQGRGKGVEITHLSREFRKSTSTYAIESLRTNYLPRVNDGNNHTDWNGLKQSDSTKDHMIQHRKLLNRKVWL